MSKTEEDLRKKFEELEEAAGRNPGGMLSGLLGMIGCLPRMELVDAALKSVGIKARSSNGGALRVLAFSGKDLDKMARDTGWPEGDYNVVVGFIIKGVKPMGLYGRLISSRMFQALVTVEILKDADAPVGSREFAKLDNGFVDGHGNIAVPASLRPQALELLNELNGYVHEGHLALSSDTDGMSGVVYARVFQLPHDDADENATIMSHVVNSAEHYIVRAVPSFMKLGTADVAAIEDAYQKQEAKYQTDQLNPMSGLGALFDSGAGHDLAKALEDRFERLRPQRGGMPGFGKPRAQHGDMQFEIGKPVKQAEDAPNPGETDEDEDDE